MSGPRSASRDRFPRPAVLFLLCLLVSAFAGAQSAGTQSGGTQSGGTQSGGTQSSGSISGIVEDASARPLAGVALALSADTGSAAPSHVTTSSQGEYSFSALPPGRYRIAAEQAGTSLSPAGAVTLTLEHSQVHLTLTLSGSRPDATPSPSVSPGLQLKAAGIRGYIDPGGYSAPAGAAAATDLVRGIADLKRANNTSDVDGSLSCSAQADLLKAVADRLQDARTNQQLGQFYLAQHQPAQALPYLQRARELNGTPAQTPLPLADALLQTGHFQSAHDLLVPSAGVGQTTVEGHRLLARADEGLGNFLDAAHEYQAAIDLHPTEEDFFGAGYEEVLAGSPLAGKALFDAGLARFPQSTLLRMGVGTVQFLASNSAEATRSFLEAANLNPVDPRPYPFLSASFEISNLEPAAVKASFHHFYSLVPDDAQAAYFYALSLSHPDSGMATENPQEIELLLKQAVQLDPGFTKAYIQLGSYYFHQERYPLAITEYQAALRLEPTLRDVHYRLAAAYKRSGDAARAAQQMQIFQAHRKADEAAEPTASIHMEDFLSVFKQAGSNARGQSGSSNCALPSLTKK